MNDLLFPSLCIKYVDDTTVASESEDPLDNSLQNDLDMLLTWCQENGMRLNPNKTKEMVIYFGKKFSIADIPKLKIGSDDLERVQTFKLLGVIFNYKLTWADHVEFILGKVSKRMFIIYQLARIGLPAPEIITVYKSLIRSVLEYSCEVWHSGLTCAQSRDLERVQKRVLQIIYRQLSYKDALKLSGLARLSERREEAIRELFKKIRTPGHILYDLLTPKLKSKFNLRSVYEFSLPRAHTARFANSFIPYCIKKRY